jgi:hypothetical protein
MDRSILQEDLGNFRVSADNKETLSIWIKKIHDDEENLEFSIRYLEKHFPEPFQQYQH